MRVLRLLLRLLPSEFQREYGRDFLETAEEQWREAAPTLPRVGRCRFWLRQWLAAIRINVSLRCHRPILGAADRPRPREDGLFGLRKDVVHGIRALAAMPGFTLVSVLTLGIGVGAATAMFTAVSSILLRELPYEDSERIVVVQQTDPEGVVEEGISAANLRDAADTSRSLSHAGVAEAHGLRLVEDGRAYSLRAWLVSDGFLEAVGAEVHLGRAFLPEEFVAGRDRVVLLSYRTWQSRFGSDPEILGRELRLDGASHTVVGVLPLEFQYPGAAELWGPRPARPWDDEQRARAHAEGVARLSSGTTVTEAQAEMDRIAAGLAAARPDSSANLGIRLLPLRQHLFGDVESPLVLLLGAVGVVLLIASANVAGLQLARAAGRSKEYALRGALGASSGRIVRLVAVESLLLAAAGGSLGIAIAYLGVDLIRTFGPRQIPRIDELGIDPPVLVFCMLAALGSAVVASIAPALRASAVDLHEALTDGSRGSTRGPRVSRLRDRLVVAEIALALVLGIGAGLLVRSLNRLLDNDLGFEPEGRLVVQVWAYDDEHRARLDFFERSVNEIRSLPGVQAVGLTTDLPLADDLSFVSNGRTVPFTVDDRPQPPAGVDPVARLSAIDGGYPEAMGVPRVAGRSFSTRDHAKSPPVAMVNQAFAKRYLEGRDPVGRQVTLHWRSESSREIVGVVADVRRHGYESDPEPEIYVPLSQEPSNGLTFVVKSALEPETLTASVHEAMRKVDPGQAAWATRPMTDLLSDWLRQRRFNTVLLAAFAALALSLAAAGVYGLMSFSVEQRFHELGIRRALGGGTRDIMMMVLSRGVSLALAGTVLGLIGSVALTRVLQGMLFEVDPLDPLTFAGLSLFVIAVAAVAALLPASRATQIDPLHALRME